MENTRVVMSEYWKHFKPTLPGMLLDTNAEAIAKMEQEEIFTYLPDYQNKSVLELGSGIGRYTGIFAEKASHVLAVDFMESFVQKNKEVNGHFSNTEFLQADVTQLQLSPSSYDLVFTNWLLMYLNDDEVHNLLVNLLKWVKKDGFLFIRESCFHNSGDGVARPAVNPTFYRHPSFYLSKLPLRIDNGHSETTTYFHLNKVTSIKTYIKGQTFIINLEITYHQQSTLISNDIQSFHSLIYSNVTVNRTNTITTENGLLAELNTFNYCK